MASGHGHSQTIDIASERRRLDEVGPLVVRLGLIVGLAGILGGLLLGLIFSGFHFSEFLRQALKSYLVSYAFILSLALGALFFVLLHHLVKAGWSVVLRRLAECAAAALPPLALLALPLVLGMGALYPWVSPEGFVGSTFADANEAHVVHNKHAYLNVPFFIIRLAVYFLIWSGLALYFFRRSVEQDATGDPSLTTRMQRLSAPGMVLFAFSLTFASFDLLMSINPLWFSTIFGVYFFAASVVSFFSALVLTAYFLQRSGRLSRVITPEHFHDVGKLVFGFIVFWTYIAFSQFMLIWYANLPEETFWYRARMEGGWGVFSLVLLFGHFVIPFLALISRHPKRMVWPLALGAGWILVMHYLDLYWLVMPVAYGEKFGQVPLSLMDLGLWIGLLGLFVSAVVTRMKSVSLVPERDPRLHESLAFENF